MNYSPLKNWIVAGLASKFPHVFLGGKSVIVVEESHLVDAIAHWLTSCNVSAVSRAVQSSFFPPRTSRDFDDLDRKAFPDYVDFPDGSPPLIRQSFEWTGIAHFRGLVVFLRDGDSDETHEFQFRGIFRSRELARGILASFPETQSFEGFRNRLLELGFEDEGLC